MSYQIIGHRGNKEKYLENTLKSFQATLDIEGCNGIELDIVVSKDRKLFISHDLYLRYNGKVVFLHLLNYDQILKISDNKEKYPLLTDVLILFKNHVNHENKYIFIELKAWPAFDNIPLMTENEISVIHEAINLYKLQKQSYIISFDYRLLLYSYHLLPKIKTGLILQRNLLPLSGLVKELSIDILVMERSWISKEQVKEMDKLGINIFAWAPNTVKEWKRLIALGVFGMITDKPELLCNYRKKNTV